MYKFSDIEKAVLASGFQFRNATGSHHNYIDKKTGICVTIPKHAKGVSVGVAQSVLKYCVLVARINRVNIGSHRHKLDKKVHKFILEHHSKCKDNAMFLVPEDHRQVTNIQTEEDVYDYLDSYRDNFIKYKFQSKNYGDAAMVM